MSERLEGRLRACLVLCKSKNALKIITKSFSERCHVFPGRLAASLNRRPFVESRIIQQES